MKPVYYASGERVRNKKKHIIADKEGFQKFQETHKAGFGLVGEKVFYDFMPTWQIDRKNKITYSTVRIFPQKKGLLEPFIEEIFEKFLPLEPVNGRASLREEQKHRHGFDIYGKKNSTHFAVGNNFLKYIPGLWWTTLYHEDLLKKHNVDPKVFEVAALSTKIFKTPKGKRVYLFKFFESPYDWEDHKNRLDKICRDTKGVFYIGPLRKEMEKYSNMESVHDIPKFWADWD